MIVPLVQVYSPPMHTCRWPIRQLDVQNVLLYDFIYEEVYMRQPVGSLIINFLTMFASSIVLYMD